MKKTYSRLVSGLKVTLALLLIVGVSESAQADAFTQPNLVSFTMSPNSIDVATTNDVVTFDLTVSNPTGIASSQTKVTFTNGSSSTLTLNLLRTDSPINNSLATVTFRGSLTVPATVAPGVYTASAAPIVALNADGSQGYATQALTATSTSTLPGAIGKLLIRSIGNLNFSYATFIGPTFNNVSGASFTDPKYTNAEAPIWKVGETFNPNDYYQLQVPGMSLKIKANTPAFCTSTGSILSFTAVGACSFTVFTDATQDYQYQKDEQVQNISSARIKPTYTIGTISTQSSTTLPLTIPGPFVYGPLGLVIPSSATPTVCGATGNYITIVSGGTCTLNYSTPASASYLASDVYPLTFQITRTAQIVSFVTPASATLASKTLTLSATASSSAPVSFQSDSPTICSVTGNSLNLLAPGNCQVEAIQAGSATVSPASAIQSIAVTGTLPNSKVSKVKTITCVKTGKSKTFTGSKCPSGFKAKK
jgi:hypothetical protein